MHHQPGTTTALLRMVRATCQAVRERAHALPEASPVRVAACAEVRRLEEQAATLAIVERAAS